MTPTIEQIQNEVMKIHKECGTTELANYKIQLLCEQNAKEMSISFAKWCNKHDWVYEPSLSRWVKGGGLTSPQTNKEIYELFLKDKNEKLSPMKHI